MNTYYKDSNNIIHCLTADDLLTDMGKQLAANPNWQVITEAQANSIINPPSAPLPNPLGFATTLKTNWGIVECNNLAASYPLFFAAITDNDWPSVQALAIDAQSKNVLSTAQYAAIKDAALANNIPVTL